MKPARFDYARPETLADAVKLLAGAGGDAKVIAGGQSLMPMLAFRLAAPKLLVDIGRLPDLKRIDVSPDGKRLLLSIDMGEESGRKDWDGPLPALWSFDLGSQKATRLTPKKLFGWDGVWIDNNNILFLSKAAGEKDDSIYRMSVDGKNLKRLIKNGRFPSVSVP